MIKMKLNSTLFIYSIKAIMKYYRTGSIWTKEEEDKLRVEIEQGCSIKHICKIHLRSKGSILDRMKKRNVPFRQAHTYEPMDIDDEPLEQDPIEQEPVAICVFDTETTGKDIPFASVSDSAKWSCIRLIQFAYELYQPDGTLLEKQCFLIKPDGFTIPDDSISIHGITQEKALTEGISMKDFSDHLVVLLPKVQTFVAHNLEYDTNVIQSELYRSQQFIILDQWKRKETECTMLMGKRYLGRWTKLAVLAEQCDLSVPKDLHQADVDTELCARIYFYLRNKHMSNQKHTFRVSMEDRGVFKLLGGRWDSGQKVWTMDEAEPYFRYVKQCFI